LALAEEAGEALAVPKAAAAQEAGVRARPARRADSPVVGAVEAVRALPGAQEGRAAAG